jgi:predicted nucleic acid-binding protein
MAADSSRLAGIDTSVLINFLRVDRVDLLALHSGFRFVLTGHVRCEVVDCYPEQLACLDRAIGEGVFDLVIVDALDPVFVRISQERRLGVGEAAAIAYAITNSLPLAIDDRRARAVATAVSASITLESTESLVVAAINCGRLTVADADAIKTEWETHHRFKLAFTSFAERVW